MSIFRVQQAEEIPKNYEGRKRDTEEEENSADGPEAAGRCSKAKKKATSAPQPPDTSQKSIPCGLDLHPTATDKKKEVNGFLGVGED